MESLKIYYIKYKYQILFVLILIIASCLRFYDLGGKSLWIDEGFTLYQVQHSISELTLLIKNDVHPPLYFYIEHFFIKAFGTSEFSLRLLSTITGILIIFTLWNFLKKHFTKKIVLISCFLTSVSTFQIQYSQEARGYALFTLLTILSFDYLIEFIKMQSWKNLIIYVIPSTLMLYTHNYAILYLGVQFLYVIYLGIKHKKNLVRLIFPFIIIFILFLPWIAICLHQILSVKSGFWIKSASLLLLFGTPYVFSGNNLILAIFLCGIIIYLFYNLYKGDKENEIIIRKEILTFFGVWLVLPVVLAYLISLYVPIYQVRYAIPSSIPFFILAAVSINQFNKKYKKILLIGISVVFLYSLVKYYISEKEDWRGAVEIVQNNYKDNEPVYLFSPWTKFVFDYYNKKKLNTLSIENKKIKLDQEGWYIGRDYDIENGFDKIETIKKNIKETYKLNELTIYRLE